jgi:PHS family inorganic phosphate transporter-like MFS transporter
MVLPRCVGFPGLLAIPVLTDYSPYYGVSLNTPIILQPIGYSRRPNVCKILINLAIGNLIVVLAGAIPGYWVTVATVDTIGRKPI